MTKDEALKQTLAALEVLIDSFADVSAYEDDEHAFTNELIFIPDIKKAIKAITAIKEALAQPEERNFCQRCGKRTADLTTIHTCTPPQEALYGMNQDDWKDVVAAISKVRDGRGIYLACRPTDVFKDWFLALGTAKVKEKNT